MNKKVVLCSALLALVLTTPVTAALLFAGTATLPPPVTGQAPDHLSLLGTGLFAFGGLVVLRRVRDWLAAGAADV